MLERDNFLCVQLLNGCLLDQRTEVRDRQMTDVRVDASFTTVKQDIGRRCFSSHTSTTELAEMGGTQDGRTALACWRTLYRPIGMLNEASLLLLHAINTHKFQ